MDEILQKGGGIIPAQSLPDNTLEYRFRKYLFPIRVLKSPKRQYGHSFRHIMQEPDASQKDPCLTDAWGR